MEAGEYVTVEPKPSLEGKTKFEVSDHAQLVSKLEELSSLAEQTDKAAQERANSLFEGSTEVLVDIGENGRIDVTFQDIKRGDARESVVFQKIDGEWYGQGRADTFDVRNKFQSGKISGNSEQQAIQDRSDQLLQAVASRLSA